jgi:hypothetical protein
MSAICGLLLALLTGCATRPATVAITPEAPSPVRKIAVGAFEGNGGPVVNNEFIRQLVGAGRIVTDQPAAADAVLSGRVDEFQPSHKLLVTLGKEPSDPAAKPVQIVMASAVVGVSARLKDNRTGKVIWTDAYQYESVNVADATQAVIATLVKSLRKIPS